MMDRHEDIHGFWFFADDIRYEVEINPNSEEARGEVPEEIGGRPVEIAERKAESKKPTTCPLESKRYSSDGDTPGGAEVYAEDNNGYGSLLPRVLNKNDSKEYFGTALHVIEECTPNEDSLMWQPGSAWMNIGFHETAKHDYDFSALHSYTAPQPKIVNPLYPDDESNWYQVGGSYSEAALDTMVNNGENVRKVGKTSCETFGDLQARGETDADDDFETCSLLWQGQVRWGSGDDAKDGDSGAPVFAFSDDGTGNNYNVASMVSGHLTQEDETGYVFGVAMYELYHNGGGWYCH